MNGIRTVETIRLAAQSSGLSSSKLVGRMIAETSDQLPLSDAAIHKVAMALYEEDLAGMIARDLHLHDEGNDNQSRLHLDATAKAAARLNVVGRDLRLRLRHDLRLDEDGSLVREYMRATAALKVVLDEIEPIVQAPLLNIFEDALELCFTLLDAIPTKGKA